MAHNCHWVCKTGHPESSCWWLRSTAQIQTFTSLPYTLQYCKLSTIHLFTHGFRGIIHTYLYLQVLQIKQIRKRSSTKIPPQLTSSDVTTIHLNTFCSPKKMKEKIYDHQKHKLYLKFIMYKYLYHICMLTISIEICPSQHNGVLLVNTSKPRMRPKVPMPSNAGQGRRPGWLWWYLRTCLNSPTVNHEG